MIHHNPENRTRTPNKGLVRIFGGALIGELAGTAIFGQFHIPFSQHPLLDMGIGFLVGGPVGVTVSVFYNYFRSRNED